MKQIIAIFMLLLLTACAAPQRIVPEEQTTVVQNETIPQKPAVEGDTITIIECKGTPEVLKINEGETLTIKNADVHPRTIYLSDKVLAIPYEGSIETIARFANGKGSYTYLCDDRGTAGTIIVS